MENTRTKALETLTRALIASAGAGGFTEAEDGGEKIFIEEEINGEKMEVCYFSLKGGKESLKELAYFIISEDEQMEGKFKGLTLQVDAEDPENPIGIIFKS